jgi:hypothetical protein
MNNKSIAINETTFGVSYLPTPDGYMVGLEVITWADGERLALVRVLPVRLISGESREDCLQRAMRLVENVCLEFNRVAREQGVMESGVYGVN